MQGCQGWILAALLCVKKLFFCLLLKAVPIGFRSPGWLIFLPDSSVPPLPPAHITGCGSCLCSLAHMCCLPLAAFRNSSSSVVWGSLLLLCFGFISWAFPCSSRLWGFCKLPHNSLLLWLVCFFLSVFLVSFWIASLPMSSTSQIFSSLASAVNPT